MKQNTKKASVISDDKGRTLWTGPSGPAVCTIRPH